MLESWKSFGGFWAWRGCEASAVSLHGPTMQRREVKRTLAVALRLPATHYAEATKR